MRPIHDRHASFHSVRKGCVYGQREALKIHIVNVHWRKNYMVGLRNSHHCKYPQKGVLDASSGAMHSVLALRSGSNMVRFRKVAQRRNHLAATSVERCRIYAIFQVSSCLYRYVYAASVNVEQRRLIMILVPNGQFAP